MNGTTKLIRILALLVSLLAIVAIGVTLSETLEGPAAIPSAAAPDESLPQDDADRNSEEETGPGQPRITLLPGPGLPADVHLDVPLISQLPELPTGCEIVSATMLLAYAGITVDKMDLAAEIPYDEEDPSLGFVGDPESWEGWTIYPEALAPALRQYLPSAAPLTEGDPNEIFAKLAEGHPVVVWLGGIYGLIEHCVILTGYDADGFLYNDPLTEEKEARLDYAAFLQMWQDLGSMALSY